jgi:hypothetical protein
LALLVAVSALAVPSAASAGKNPKPPPPPSTPKVYKVPGKIHSDCSVATDADLTAWLATVPDNSIVEFPANRCYGEDGTITVTGKNGIVIDAKGTEFRALTPGNDHRSNWSFVGGSRLTVMNMAVRGSNPSGSYSAGYEWQHGIGVNGVQGMTISNVQVRETWGDGIDIWRGAGSPACGDNASSARDVLVTGSTLERIGRQGVAIVDAERVTVQDSSIGPVAWYGVDLETDADCDIGRHVTVTRNTFGASRYGIFANYGFGGDPQVGDVSVTDNVETAPTGGPAAGECYSPIGARPPSGLYRSGYRFTGNRLLARRFAFNLVQLRDVQIDSNNATFDNAFGCSPIVGVNLTDAHSVAITNNVFSGASAVYRADAATTDVTSDGNTTG